MILAMRTIFLFTAATLGLAMGLISTSAAADGGMYISGTYGRALNTFQRTDMDNAVVAAFSDTLTLDASSSRKSGAIWSASIGYMASPSFGIEASYLNLGTLEYHSRGSRTTSGGTQSVAVDLNMKSRGPALSLLWAVPMWNAWGFDARVGAYRGKTSTEFVSTIDDTSTPGSEAPTSTSLLLGVGGSYAVSARFILRLDYIRLNDLKEGALQRKFDTDLVTAGLTYAF